MEAKYPFQICTIKRRSVVLSVDAKLSSSEQKDAPLELHDPFSRFVVTIVNGMKKTYPKANIPIKDIPFLCRAGDCAIRALLSGRDKGTPPSGASDGKGLAYTERLTGIFAGKTPAEILVNPSRRGDLIKQREWLKSNLPKYPNNQRGIDAIDDAVRLLDAGELSCVEAGGSNTLAFPVYSAEYKYFRTKDKEGNNLCYQVKILFDSSKNYPFEVTIENFYAPVRDNKIVFNKAKGKTKEVISLSNSEFVFVLDRIKVTKEAFENKVFNALT